MSHDGFASIGNHDTDCIKSIRALWMAMLRQPELRDLPEFALFGGRDVTFRIIVPVAGQRLHFHKDDRVANLGDDIEFTQWAGKVLCKNLVPQRAEELLRGFLPDGPKLFGVADHGWMKAVV